ncbi:MAG: ribbon-helix-helix domain-containing protein [Aeromonas popoffii]|uniref:ribbon-helix-helix domain-containing protein n=1 Tax=Aeromonas popoffii TaxID=70856 RepID=UPI003F3053D8
MAPLKNPKDKGAPAPGSTRPTVSPEAADRLADQLADKPYGSEPKVKDTLRRTSISLPESMLHRCEELAFDNKRSGKHPRSVSAIILEALNKYYGIGESENRIK